MRFLVLATIVAEDTSAWVEDFRLWLDRVLPKLGGRLESLDWTLGEYNAVLFLDLPDESAAAAWTDLALRAGKFKAMRVTALIERERVSALVRGAQEALKERPAASAIISEVPDALISRPAADVTIPPPVATAPPGGPSPSLALEQDAAAALLGQRPPVDPMTSMASPAADSPPGAYDVIAGRFTRFSELAGLSETLQALPGVQSVTTRQFLRGTVSLRVHYDSPIPLAVRLADLRQFKPMVRAIGPAQLEMILFAEGRDVPDAVPAPSPASGPKLAAGELAPLRIPINTSDRMAEAGPDEGAKGDGARPAEAEVAGRVAAALSTGGWLHSVALRESGKPGPRRRRSANRLVALTAASVVLGCVTLGAAWLPVRANAQQWPDAPRLSSITGAVPGAFPSGLGETLQAVAGTASASLTADLRQALIDARQLLR